MVFVSIPPIAVAPRTGRRAGDRQCSRHFDVSNNLLQRCNLTKQEEELPMWVFFCFGLYYKRKQLETSPATARGPQRSAYNRENSSSAY